MRHYSKVPPSLNERQAAQAGKATGARCQLVEMLVRTQPATATVPAAAALTTIITTTTTAAAAAATRTAERKFSEKTSSRRVERVTTRQMALDS